MSQEYNQDGSRLQNLNPGQRVRDFEPGSRVRQALGRGEGDMMQASEMSMPENPGPSAAGRTPVLGTLRRQMGAPVLRDQLPNLMD